ncbi:DNA damage-inducible protein D [uncultured Roseobacter sp.]|uniref:DNA damage-inducible protein D n=1 Tax=uncultured Roseobacter sp. TaxID=114847 RepID=UPI00262CF731|nr:DNA damage-inducible protein D [uncultured Roseobacter sp.]
MAADLPSDPKYRSTMDRLEDAKNNNSSGAEYWFAREIQSIFGYESWAKFEPVVDRAASSMRTNGIQPSQHIVQTGKMVAVGSNAKRKLTEYFLSRGACYLIAMNGDPSKPEIAAAQAYFASQTRAREVEVQVDGDEKRVEMRQKVKQSFKAVSGAAKKAGVKNNNQPRFHDARYQGLYGMTARSVKDSKGLGAKEALFDRMGALELSANDFQMNLAAETLEKESIRGETEAISKNKAIAEKVRKTMIDSGSRPPEELPVEEPIKLVEKRLKGKCKGTKALPPNA